MKSSDPTQLKVEALRNAARLKQKQLSGLLGIDQTYLSKIERGHIQMQEYHIQKLCKLYGFDAWDFEELEANDLVAAFIKNKQGKIG